MIVLFVAFLFGFEAISSESKCTHSSNSFHCVKYVKNYDGDTVTVNIPSVHEILGKNAKIRVRGIDTPEIRSKSQCEKSKARIAKKLVESELKSASRIDLKNCSRGKYFRLVCDIIYDNKDISSVLMKNKLGYSYSGGKKQNINWCLNK